MVDDTTFRTGIGASDLHDITLLENNGSLYRLVAWTTADSAGNAPEDFREFVRSFSLLHRDTDAMLVSEITPDAQGLGWRVQRGIWQGPHSGLRQVVLASLMGPEQLVDQGDEE